jgi:hypothetical protein
MSSITESSIKSMGTLESVIEEAKMSRVLDLRGYRFDQCRFDNLTTFLSESPQLSQMFFSKTLLNEPQVERLLKITNSNLMKGVKLLDDEGVSFGAAYTNWHIYNQDKKEACELNETTLKALKNFESPPKHVIDFGAGVGQETLALLQCGCLSVVAIEGDNEAVAILRKRGEAFIEKESLVIFEGGFLKYSCEKQADLFISSFTWPYRPQEDFAACWEKTEGCVKPGGWIAGHFFGAPPKADPAMSYHSRDEIYELLSLKFENISIREEASSDHKIYGGNTPPWGILYHVVAQKKSG